MLIASNGRTTRAQTNPHIYRSFLDQVAMSLGLVAICTSRVGPLEKIMSFAVEALEAEALNLSITDRARLVEKLIVSLDSEPDVEAAWAAEVERRHAEMESGTVSLIPGPEALARLKAEFQ